MHTNVTKTIIPKKVMLLNRENVTLINPKILITYSDTVAIIVTFAPKWHKADYWIKKTPQYILRKKRNVETISLFIFKVNVRKIDIDWNKQ